MSIHDPEIFTPISQMDGCVSLSSSGSENIFALASRESSPPQSSVSAPHAQQWQHIQNGQKGQKGQKVQKGQKGQKCLKGPTGQKGSQKRTRMDEQIKGPSTDPSTEQIKGPSPALIFSRRISKLKLKVHDKGGGGHCQYLSIAHQLQIHGLGDFSQKRVRVDLATWLRAHEHYVVEDGGALRDMIVTHEYLEDGNRNPNFDGHDWQDFCDRVEDTDNMGRWGNHVTLVASTVVWGVALKVTGVTSEFDHILQPTCFTETLHLGHIPEQHFVSLTVQCLSLVTSDSDVGLISRYMFDLPGTQMSFCNHVLVWFQILDI